MSGTVKQRLVIGATMLVCALAWMIGCSGTGSPKPVSMVPHRIISLSPSITETLFALGLDNRLVAVTDFCLYPPQAVRLPKVGGYINPNYEQVLALKPDLVILRREHAPAISFLEQSGIAYVTVENHNLAAIFDSFRRIGNACGVPERGDSLARAVEKQLRGTHTVSPPPSVLLCIGRNDMGSGRIAGVFIAGRGTYLQELMEAAGGVGVPDDGVGGAYPSLSVEAIVRLAPDIIVDLAADVCAADTARVKADWNVLAGVPAVRRRMVFCLTGTYTTIPGPRIVRLFSDLCGIVARWQAVQSSDDFGEMSGER